jgi:hypothetical protein
MEGGSLNPQLEKEIHALDFLSFGEREDILSFPRFLEGSIARLSSAARGPDNQADSAERLGNKHSTRRSSYGLRELPIIKANSRGR